MAFSVIFVHFVFAPKNHISFLQSCAFGFAVITTSPWTGWYYIGKEISGTEYDVAHVKWGGKWRMPTKAECEELLEKCSFEWITLNGMSGYHVTGPNGKSIFLPASGGYYYSSNLVGFGDRVCIWIGTQYGTNAEIPTGTAYLLYNKYLNYSYRYDGFPVRPVCE